MKLDWYIKYKDRRIIIYDTVIQNIYTFCVENLFHLYCVGAIWMFYYDIEFDGLELSKLISPFCSRNFTCRSILSLIKRFGGTFLSHTVDKWKSLVANEFPASFYMGSSKPRLKVPTYRGGI